MTEPIHVTTNPKFRSKEHRRVVASYLDDNGCPTDVISDGGMQIEVHYDDVPESDITTVRGLPCTTPARTIIDLAPSLSAAELEDIIDHMLRTEQMTMQELHARIAAPDMLTRRGAVLLREFLR